MDVPLWAEKAAKEEAAKPDKPAKAVDKKMFAGVVTKVDTAAKFVTIKNPRGEVTFDVSAAKYGKKMSLETLKVGTKVLVKIEEKGGKMTGMKIMKAPKKPKVEKKEEKAEAKPETKAEEKPEAKPEEKPAPGK